MKKTCSTINGSYQIPCIETLHLECCVALAVSVEDGVVLDDMIEVEETW